MLYAVAGDGTGNLTEIRATLEDLRAKATADEAEFWFLLMAKDDPSKTEQAIVKWLVDNEIYFETVGSGYEGAQDEHDIGEDAYATFLEKVQEQTDGVAVLSLFVDNENEADEDTDLYSMIEAAVEAGVEVRLLNGQMVRLQLAAGEEEEAEAETVAAPEAADEGDEAPEEPERAFTEAELKKMTVPELTAIAKGQGINVPKVDGKSPGKGDIIAALLGGEAAPKATPAAEVTGVSTGGALLVILVNGSIHVKPVTIEEAAALV